MPIEQMSLGWSSLLDSSVIRINAFRTKDLAPLSCKVWKENGGRGGLEQKKLKIKKMKLKLETKIEWSEKKLRKS